MAGPSTDRKLAAWDGLTSMLEYVAVNDGSFTNPTTVGVTPACDQNLACCTR